jgi:hypothetical protein
MTNVAPDTSSAAEEKEVRELSAASTLVQRILALVDPVRDSAQGALRGTIKISFPHRQALNWELPFQISTETNQRREISSEIRAGVECSSPKSGVLVFTFSGLLMGDDVTATLIRKNLQISFDGWKSENASEKPNVILDYTGVKRVANDGVTADLLMMHRRVKKMNGKTGIVHASDDLTELLRRTSVEKLVPRYESVEDAIKQMTMRASRRSRQPS